MKNTDLKGTRIKGYLSLAELAHEIGLSKQRAHILIQQDRIKPVFHFEGVYLIPESTLKKFLEDRRKGE